MGKILEELEKHLVDVAERVAEHIEDGDLNGDDDWEVHGITIITGRNKKTQQQFHTVTHTKETSIPEVIGTMELVKTGIIQEALFNDDDE